MAHYRYREGVALLTPGATGQLLHLSPQAVREWEGREGGLTACVTPGGHRRYRLVDVQRLLLDPRYLSAVARLPPTPAQVPRSLVAGDLARAAAEASGLSSEETLPIVHSVFLVMAEVMCTPEPGEEDVYALYDQHVRALRDAGQYRDGHQSAPWLRRLPIEHFGTFYVVRTGGRPILLSPRRSAARGIDRHHWRLRWYPSGYLRDLCNPGTTVFYSHRMRQARGGARRRPTGARIGRPPQPRTLDSRRCLILDIDGVLACSGDYRRWPYGVVHGTIGDHVLLDRRRCALVDRLCRMTGAQLVLSSTWRTQHPFEELVQMLRMAGIAAPIRGCTPSLPGGHRGEEIEAWCQAEGVTDSSLLVILDDEDNLEPYRARWVQCTYHGAGAGFQRAHFKRALKLWGLPQLMIDEPEAT